MKKNNVSVDSLCLINTVHLGNCTSVFFLSESELNVAQKYLVASMI